MVDPPDVKCIDWRYNEASDEAQDCTICMWQVMQKLQLISTRRLQWWYLT